MSLTRGFRHGRHFTGRHAGRTVPDGRVDFDLALHRISLLAAGMAFASIFELLLVVVVKSLLPDAIPVDSQIAKFMMAGALGMSCTVLILCRFSRISNILRLVIGVSYVLLMVIVISAAEVSTQWWVKGDAFNGMPWVCIWLLLVPLVVPIRWEKAMARGVLLSVLPVLVMAVSIRVFDLPPASVEAYVGFFLPCLIVTVLALVIARMMGNLTRQVQEAKQLGAYELEEKIGEGGMGEVWRARHRMLVRPAAVKLIRPENLGDGSAGQDILIERFQREAQATASLNSPHTVDLYDFGVADDGTFFYVMELLAGMDVQSMVKRFGPLTPGRTIYLMCQMCDSLAEAHAHGLLHRDIKPANIFVCRAGEQRDFVKILDFGLVKSLDEAKGEIELTSHTAVIGTPSVMAPETISGSPIDHRLDIYGLGCVGYTMLTGSPVFSADTPLAMAVAHAKDEPVAPSKLSELEIPAELERIILDCLEKDPSRRPASAGELFTRLDECSCKDVWNRGKATQWWEMHLPEVGAVRGESA